MNLIGKLEIPFSGINCFFEAQENANHCHGRANKSFISLHFGYVINYAGKHGFCNVNYGGNDKFPLKGTLRYCKNKEPGLRWILNETNEGAAKGNSVGVYFGDELRRGKKRNNVVFPFHRLENERFVSILATLHRH